MSTRFSRHAEIAAPTAAQSEPQEPLLWWKIAALFVVLIAAGLRLWHLDLVPFHHDEGVNANFLMTLFKSGTYAYDPTNYHGPTLYYFALVPVYINTFLFGQSGLNDFSLRVVPALFGVGVVVLTLCLRRNIGGWASLLAAALLAISPGMVFISRYFIHEMHFVFFTFAAVLCMLRFRETGRASWPILASLCFALVFASKETAPISLAVLFVAWVLTALLCNGRLPHWRAPGSTPRAALVVAVACALAFAVVIVVFFTSFGKNYPKGLKDFFAAYAVWTKTGNETQIHPFLTYVVWMLTIEPPIFILGMLGAALALWQGRNHFLVFCALWACGLLLAYSKIGYKTPWLMLSFLLPFAILGGWTLQEFGAWLGARGASTTSPIAHARKTAWASALLFAPIFFIAFTQMRFLNFIEYDHDEPLTNAHGEPRQMLGMDIKKYPYIYTHTQRGYFDLLREIDEYASRSGLGKKMPIMIAAPEYWPMPWYLRDYPVGYYSRVVPPQNEVVIIGMLEQDDQLRRLAGSRYARAGQYPLRPGVLLTLWVRRDLISSEKQK